MVNEHGYSGGETDALLRAFAGHAMAATGQVSQLMSVDGLDFDTTAVVTHLKLPANIDVLIVVKIVQSGVD